LAGPQFLGAKFQDRRRICAVTQHPGGKRRACQQKTGKQLAHEAKFRRFSARNPAGSRHVIGSAGKLASIAIAIEG
jgi:hypothetical protein